MGCRDTTACREEAGKALDHIWQAQCNCAYWHGVFGGLYLPHLRFGLYRNLIQAQAKLDGAVAGGPGCAGLRSGRIGIATASPSIP